MTYVTDHVPTRLLGVWLHSFIHSFAPGRFNHIKNARKLAQRLVHAFGSFHFLLTFAPGRPNHIKNARKLVQRLVHAFGSFHFY